MFEVFYSVTLQGFNHVSWCGSIVVYDADHALTLIRSYYPTGTVEVWR
jgi:hypothetical protein